MHQTCPLPDTHPELTIVHWPGFTEYRVENWNLVRNGSGRVVRGTSLWTWLDMLVLVGLLFGSGRASVQLPVSSFVLLALCITSTYLVYTRFTQVLHESILVFPTLGIQLETSRGHPLIPFPILTTRHFIPLSALEDVVIHEGFRRWDVRFYLAAVRRINGGGIEVCVAFKNILPHFPVLERVYLGVQETVFPPLIRESVDNEKCEVCE